MTKILLPPGWRAPTAQTLSQYHYGRQHGLAPAGHEVLRSPAEPVTPDMIASRYVLDVIGLMRGIVAAAHAAGRPIQGLAAVQVGEPIQAALLLRPEPIGTERFMPVFNHRVEIDPATPLIRLPHGCYSSNEIFARMLTPTSLTLEGLDEHGDPLRIEERTGMAAASDFHEMLHHQGTRAADVLHKSDEQLDWRPPEMRASYASYFASQTAGIHQAEWSLPYLHDQWLAVRSGHFLLEHFV